MKRALKIVGIVVLVLVLAVVGTIASAFIGNKPLVDGAEFPGARTVLDGYVSFYVLDAGGGALALIDSGNDPTGKALLAELARRKATPADVKAVFLTHGHSDHIGGLKAVPNAAVYAMADEVPYLEGKLAFRGPITRMMGAKDSGVRLTRALEPGAQVQVGELTVEALRCPGHTAGSGAYLANGVLFLGDSADASTSDELHAAKWLFTDDQPQNIASLKALEQGFAPTPDRVKFLVFAHSGPLPGLAPLQAFAKSH